MGENKRGAQTQVENVGTVGEVQYPRFVMYLYYILVI